MGGFVNSISNKNDAVFAKNADFTLSPDPSSQNGLITNGQLWIGHTDANEDAQHVYVGSLTSPDSSLTVGYSSPNITLIANGSAIGKTITGNTGGALSPTGGNWNVYGPNSALTGYSPWITGSGSTLTVNMPGTVKWVVNPVAGLGTHTTIQAAITAASSGENIFITPGTYTESLTLKAGVNIVGYSGDGRQAQVTIIGKLTATFTGACVISNIRLQTNSDYFLVVSGSNATNVILTSCFLRCLNASGINFTSSSSGASIEIEYCRGAINNTGITMFVATSPGVLTFKYCEIPNPGNSTTASTGDSTILFAEYCIFGFLFSFSTTGYGQFYYCHFSSGLNATVYTSSGTAQNHFFQYCYFVAGSSSVISIGSGTLCSVYDTNLFCSNPYVITGAGTLSYSGLTFPNSSVINPTTQTAVYTNLGKWKASGQPAFLAQSSGAQNNVTGDGTAYTVQFATEIFDQNSNYDTGTGIFTAPVTGLYQFNTSVNISIDSGTGGTEVYLDIVASNRTLSPNTQPTRRRVTNYFGVNNYITCTGSVLVDMDAADTCRIQITSAGGSKTDDVGASTAYTYFSGNLFC